MKNYQVQWGKRFWIPLGMIFLLIALFYFITLDVSSSQPTILLPFLAPILYLFWLRWKTSYQLSGETLYYNDGLKREKIAVESIKKVEVGKSWRYFGENHLIINYNSYDTVFLNPIDRNSLISGLKQINPEIEVL